MKKILMAALIVFSSQSALASEFIMGLALGNMMSGGERVVTKEVKVDKFSMVVEETHKQMDLKIRDKVPTITIDYKGLNTDEYESYFKMKKFDILRDGTKLTFNLSPFIVKSLNNYQNFEWHQIDQDRKQTSLLLWFIIGFLLFLAIASVAGEAAFLILIVFNIGWATASGNLFLKRAPLPKEITSLPSEIKSQLPVEWQEAKVSHKQEQ